jgi:hypothetical protein
LRYSGDRGSDSTSPIGYYEDKFLNFEVESGTKLVYFRRCLSYQNYVCFYKLAGFEQPDNFSIELGNPDGWAIKRNNLISMKFTSEKDLSESAEVDYEDI